MKNLLAFLLLSVAALAADKDVRVPQYNATTGAWPPVTVSPAASSLLGFGSDKTVGNVTMGTGMSLSGGVLTSTVTGTVTSVSVTTANGVSGSVATATTTPAITLTLGAITPSQVTVTKTGAGDTNLYVTGDAGQYRLLRYTSAGVMRWAVYVGGQTESGANVGSDFSIARYSDAGAYITDALNINRATGVTALTAPIKAAHFAGNVYFPSIVAGTGAGTSPTIAVAGSDVGFELTLTTGSSPGTSATIGTVTWGLAYEGAPYAVFSPSNANAAALAVAAHPYVSATSTTTLTFTSGSTGLTGATQYKWMFIVVQ